MNREEKIRAKALEIAARILGEAPTKPGTRVERDEFMPIGTLVEGPTVNAVISRYLPIARAIEHYLHSGELPKG